MTTELEKEFFEAFGIEPEKIYLCPLCKSKLSGCTWVGDKQRFECVYSWGEHPYYMGDEVEEKAIIDYEYPQITDRHYLELICTVLAIEPIENIIIYSQDGQNSRLSHLKKNLLDIAIRTSYNNKIGISEREDFKQLVQNLFI